MLSKCYICIPANMKPSQDILKICNLNVFAVMLTEQYFNVIKYAMLPWKWFIHYQSYKTVNYVYYCEWEKLKVPPSKWKSQWPVGTNSHHCSCYFHRNRLCPWLAQHILNAISASQSTFIKQFMSYFCCSYLNLCFESSFWDQLFSHTDCVGFASLK